MRDRFSAVWRLPAALARVDTPRTAPALGHFHVLIALVALKLERALLDDFLVRQRRRHGFSNQPGHGDTLISPPYRFCCATLIIFRLVVYVVKKKNVSTVRRVHI